MEVHGMPSWTCPNPKCKYEEQLQSGQHCPLCGKEAKEFEFSEFGNLLREKWNFKKSIERTEYPLRIEEGFKSSFFCMDSRVFYDNGCDTMFESDCTLKLWKPLFLQ